MSGSDIVARMGGDEFMVLTSNSAVEDLEYLSRRLLDAFRRPFRLKDRSISITLSIGVVTSLQDGDDPETLIRNVDIALYRSKASGRNICTEFQPFMLEDVKRQADIEQELQKSIIETNNDFWLVFQPQVSCDGRRQLMGAEALLRWKGPWHELVGPAEFIPIAEAMGLIRTIDHLVIKLAVQQIASWVQAGMAIPVSVNISAISLQTEGFAEQVLQHLQSYNVQPSLFMIEIVETICLDSSRATSENLAFFAEAGVDLSIDDFGTGHSSLSYLRRLPVKYVKMDRSFIDNVGIGSDNDDSLALAILSLGKALNIDVIAEGVETEAQFNRNNSRMPCFGT